ncbi:phenylacetate--CoA ligase family protein [Algicola sagamiensis]|uniref:phenylacetate--CoA ligase family protein n=1 Tax=Algicola sagamiensis TaxID=163869 RepID=UPI00037E4D36|nr:AMP-binding protein [Algicola sagamiensis]
MKVYTLNELVDYAKTHSEYYRVLYQDVRPDFQSIAELPVVESNSFWQANSSSTNTLLTGHPTGVVFKSGGTTGVPKVSYYTQQEWDSFCQAFGHGLVRGGLVDGERIANLFYAGDLYASFLFIHHSIEQSTVQPLQFPIAGSVGPESTIKTLCDFGIETLVGLPTSVMALVNAIQMGTVEASQLNLKKILFGGEPFFESQRKTLRDFIPEIHIQSIGYASVDAGLLGFATPDCDINEHVAFDESILEILDEETLEPITQVNCPGKVYITNLTRKLMPIIRYPAGDRAMWTTSPLSKKPRFQLLGRSDEAARVGPVTVYTSDIQKLLEEFQSQYAITDFQLLVQREEDKDFLTLRLVSLKGQETHGGTQAIQDAFYTFRPLYLDFVREDQLGPLQVEWITAEALICNSRTGKQLKVIDRRITG